MKWASSVVEGDPDDATLDAAAAEVARALGGAADLAMLFVAGDGVPVGLPARLARALGGAVVLGGGSAGVIGGEREVEQATAVSVLAARLPGVELTKIRLGTELTAAPSEASLRAALRGIPDAAAGMLLFADPRTTRVEPLLRALDQVLPETPKVGALVSGDPGAALLCLGAEVHQAGAVAVVLRGDVVMEVLVAQGCRPVGPAWTVTRGAGNVVESLEGQPALAALEQALDALDPATRSRVQRQPLLGFAADPSRRRRGDVLVRPIVGVDPGRGAVVVGHPVRPGEPVQLQTRDAVTASAELEELTSGHARRVGPVSGALLLSCLGRGTALYGRPDHDRAVVAGRLGAPVGGMFCAGEIGPMHGVTRLHGYTSVVATFRAQVWD